MRGGPACRTSTGRPRSSSPSTASPPPLPERDQRPFGHRRVPGDNGLMPDGPLIVQSDKSLLLEVDHPRADEARRAIAQIGRASCRERGKTWVAGASVTKQQYRHEKERW